MRVLRSALAFLLGLVVALPAGAQAVEACPATSSSIVINEIMYDSPGSPDVEYIELYNDGPTPVDLTNWFLLDDLDTHDKCFLVGTLNPGEYLVIAGFISLFSAKYPGVTNINVNEFDDSVIDQGFVLGDGGDAVRVFNDTGVLTDCVVYNDTPPWPTEPDGDGPSLELYHPSLDNTLATSWAASTNTPPEGTPGAQNSVFTIDQPPIVSSLARDIALPSNSDTVTVVAVAMDLVGMDMVELLVDSGSGFVAQLMFDDGLHGDAAAGDDLYGTQLPPHAGGTLVRYYARATDTAAQTTLLPWTAPAEYFAYTVDHEPPSLVINEILASNATGIVDETGTQEDWLEIRNTGAVPVNLENMFLSNSLQQSMEWQLPAVTIDPGAYLVVWADDDVIDGPLHTNFKLSASGSAIAIWETVDHGNVLIQGYKFGVQSPDVSYGYFPEADRDAPEYLTSPTPGASNDTSTLFSAIAINEFLTTSASGGIDDWVELFNRGTSTVNMSGWYLTDEVDQPTKFLFPVGVFVNPGAFVVLNETLLGFAFSSTGSEVIMLSDATSAGKDFFDYGPQEPDITRGRFPDGAANWFSFDVATGGFPNNCAVVPPANACDDGNPCTDDVCVGGSVCMNTPNDANSCGDEDACNGIDSCSAGVCITGTPVTCDAATDCDGGQTCNPANGTCEDDADPAAGVACDLDADLCTLDTCDGAGTCVTDSLVDCDDASACTSDVCVAGTCFYSSSGLCSISGEVNYYRDDTAGGFEPSAKPVPGIGIDIDQDSGADDTTETNGGYSVGRVYGSFVVTPLDKFGISDADADAITSFDASFVAQHAVGLVTLSEVQQIAGDVSGDGTLSALDATMISEFSVELIDHFDVADQTGTDWGFLRCDNYVDASNHDCGAPSYSHDPLIAAEVDDFHALLFGDVTGNWQPPGSSTARGSNAEREVAQSDREEALRLRGSSSPALVESRRRPPETRRVSKTLLELLPAAAGLQSAGTPSTYRLNLREGDGVRGLDIELHYDRDHARIVSIQKGELCGGFKLVANDVQGIYKIALYGVVPLQGSGTVLSIVVESVGSQAGGSPLKVHARADERRVPVEIKVDRPTLHGDRFQTREP